MKLLFLYIAFFSGVRANMTILQGSSLNEKEQLQTESINSVSTQECLTDIAIGGNAILHLPSSVASTYVPYLSQSNNSTSTYKALSISTSSSFNARSTNTSIVSSKIAESNTILANDTQVTSKTQSTSNTLITSQHTSTSSIRSVSVIKNATSKNNGNSLNVPIIINLILSVTMML